jgi:cytochrome d ubiquinol oxidase subunit II
MDYALLLTAVMFGAMTVYALLAGADFGAGLWDLFSTGPRRHEQRARIAEAIGPVWEANHVWLIFVIVLLFTCFPPAYAAASTALFWPLHLVLGGIVLRGAAFVFRAYGATGASTQATWGHVFGSASIATPVLLGMCLGAVSAGRIRIGSGGVVDAPIGAWLSPFPAAVGVLTLLLFAYLAAIFLAWESAGAVRDDFRRRAVIAWVAAGVLSLGTLWLARAEAPRLWEGLLSIPAVLFVAVGIVLAPVSLLALWRAHFSAARILAGLQVTALLGGWAAAQWPYLIYPDLTIAAAAAPEPTLRFVAWGLPFGAVVLVPSLWYLFAVFKGRNPKVAAKMRGGVR